MTSASSNTTRAVSDETRPLPTTDARLRSNEREHSWRWLDLARIVFVAVSAIAVWFRWFEPLTSFNVIGILATLIGGYPICRESIENVLERRMTMELSMAIALFAALMIREFFTALIITLFVLIAEVLERMTVSRGRRAIGGYALLAPAGKTDGQPQPASQQQKQAPLQKAHP